MDGRELTAGIFDQLYRNLELYNKKHIDLQSPEFEGAIYPRTRRLCPHARSLKVDIRESDVKNLSGSRDESDPRAKEKSVNLVNFGRNHQI